MSNKHFLPKSPEEREIPILEIGKQYYICFHADITHQCRLIDVFENMFGSFIYISIDNEMLSTVRPYCIGKTKKQAIENTEIENSYNIPLSKLTVLRPYIN